LKIKTIVLATALLAAAAFGARLAFSPVEVETAAAVRGLAVEAVYATGSVEPVRWVKVSPTVSARILDVAVQEGAAIKEGQRLAWLDDGEQRARVSELAARERFLKEDVGRVKALAAREFASRQANDRAQSDLAQAEASRAAAQRKLSEFTLIAPISGLVLRRDGEEGEVVQPGQVMFWIGETKPLRVVAEVDEEDIPRLKLGQRALIKADAFPGEALESKVGEITPKGDPVNRTYRVRLMLPDDTKLLVGMTVEVNVIIREAPEALLIPAAAVAEGMGWVVKNGQAERRKLKLGALGESQVEVLSGLSEGERVILRPPKGLEQGQRVTEKPVAK
jgi:RND family efflux transporter MFP subunit